MFMNDSPLQQLSYFDLEKISKLTKRSKRLPPLIEWVNAPIDQRKFTGIVPDEDKDIVNNQIDLFPRITASVQVIVNEEKEIVEGDIVSIKVKLIREHLKEGTESKCCHSLKYPFMKEENWILLLIEPEKNIVIYLKYVKL